MPLFLSGFAMEDALLLLFAGLGVAGILCQLIPGCLLFVSMVRSMLGYTSLKIDTTANQGEIN